jgi:uncharacterized membrane protein
MLAFDDASAETPQTPQDTPRAAAFPFTRPKRVMRLLGRETATERLNRVLPWTTLATDRFAAGVYRVPSYEAKRMREVALDPKGWVTALKFDVDGSDASTRWIDAGLPEPNFIVMNPANGHAHLVYLLAAWVHVDPSKRATQWLAAIERAMTAALQADTRYAGTLVHNPLNTDAWNVKVARDEPFTLAELHSHVDMHAPRPAWTSADSGVGRNVDVFERTRLWAYKAAARGRTGSFPEWARAVHDRAEQCNEFPNHPKGNLTLAEVRAIAKSIATWVWMNYDRDHDDAAARARRRDYERERQARREAARHRSTMTRDEYVARAAERRTAAAQLRSEGFGVREISDRLTCSVREVYRLLAVDAAGTVATTVRAAAATVVDAVRSIVDEVVHGSPALSGSWGRREGPRSSAGPSHGLAYVLQRCRELASLHELPRPDRTLPSGPGLTLLDFAADLAGVPRAGRSRVPKASSA